MSRTREFAGGGRAVEVEPGWAWFIDHVDLDASGGVLTFLLAGPPAWRC